MPRLQQPLIDYRGATILSTVDGACWVGLRMTGLITRPEPYKALLFKVYGGHLDRYETL